MKERKTTYAGIAAILTAVAAVFSAMAEGTLNTTIVSAAAMGVITGIGLIFARDSSTQGKPVTIREEQTEGPTHPGTQIPPAPGATSLPPAGRQSFTVLPDADHE